MNFTLKMMNFTLKMMDITTGDNILSPLGGLQINQVINMAEAMSGCEAKNRYTVHSWSPGDELEGPQIMHIREESDSCERVCCKQQRHCSLYVHEGHNETGDIILQVLAACCLTACCLLLDRLLLAG